MVNHEGIFYIFDDDFAGGTFNEALPYISNTSVATQLELMPDKIIQEVSGKHYSRTFVQVDDPALDPGNEVRYGDYWLCMEEGMKWLQAKQYSWQTIKTKTWSNLKGFKELYCYNGTNWMQVSEHASISDAFTRITQTQDMIQQEAERAQGAFIAKTLQLQTADQIVHKAERYTDGKLLDYSTIEQTATQIALYVTNNAYSKVSGITINSDGVTLTGSKYILLNTSGYVGIGDWKFNTSGLVLYDANDDPEMQFGRYSDKLAGIAAGVFTKSDGIVFHTHNISGSRDLLFEIASGGFASLYPSTNEYMDLGKSDKLYTRVYAQHFIGLDQLNASFIFSPSGESHPTLIMYADSTYSYFSGSNTKIICLELTQTSSRDIKHNIRPMESMGNILDRLEPVTYEYDSDDGVKRYGLIYEDTFPVMPDICSKDESNKCINYVELIPMLLKEIQELRGRVAALERS